MSVTALAARSGPWPQAWLTHFPAPPESIWTPIGSALDSTGRTVRLCIILLVLLFLSYRQTIAAYPKGGGSYTVAGANLGTRAGLLAAAALMLDYILVVAVGISAGVGALVSAVPFLHPYILPLCLTILGFITLVNLRGARESGLVFILPTYLFVGSVLAVLAIGVFKTIASGGHPVAVEPPPTVPPATTVVSAWLLLPKWH